MGGFFTHLSIPSQIKNTPHNTKRRRSRAGTPAKGVDPGVNPRWWRDAANGLDGLSIQPKSWPADKPVYPSERARRRALLCANRTHNLSGCGAQTWVEKSLRKTGQRPAKAYDLSRRVKCMGCPEGIVGPGIHKVHRASARPEGKAGL
jgi:hypothetical protein